MNDANTRDHLANERTFLAWVRTSIALISFGVVIARLRFLVMETPAAVHARPHTGAHSTELGLTFAAVGLLTLAFAAAHYEQSRRAIDAGQYRASGRVVLVFTGIVFLLGLVSVGYLLSLFPSP